jgi:hypothetical protein
MSDGKGGRGGEDAEKTKGRKGSTSKDSLIATTKTPTAALKDSKTPRTPEAHALRDRAVVDAAARQASMGNPGMLENLQSYIDNTPGKLRQPVNTEEVKALVSEFRDQMSKSPAVPATAMPDLLERLAHQRERPEDEDFEDDDSLYNEGLQLALEASNLEIAQLRAQVAGYHDLQKQSFLEVFPDPTEVPKSTKAAANKNGKVLPKKRSSSPPPLETITPVSHTSGILARLDQRLNAQMEEQSRVNSELLGAISSIQRTIAFGSPLAPPGPQGSGAGADSHGSAVFRPDPSATASSSSRSFKAQGNTRSAHVSTSPPKSSRHTHTGRDDDDDQRSQFSDDTVEAELNISAEEARDAAIERININFGGQHAEVSLTADELLSLIHSKNGLELLTLDGGVAVHRGDSSMKTRPCNSRGSPKISELAYEGTLGPMMSRLCYHIFPLNPNQMLAGQADYVRVLDEMAMQRLVHNDCEGAMAILNEKKQYSILFEMIGDIFAEVLLTTDSIPTNGRWATTYTIILLLVMTQLQRVSLNRLNPALLPGKDIYALVTQLRSLWQMKPSRECQVAPTVPGLYMAFTILWVDCFVCGSRTCNKATCTKCQSSATSYKAAKASHDKAKSDYVRALNAKSPAHSKADIVRLKKEWDIQYPAPSEDSAAPLESLLEIQHTVSYRRLLKNRYMY